MDAPTLEILRECSVSIKTPTLHNRVYKDQCMFSFDTAESEGGLFVSLVTFQSYGKDFVQIYQKKTGERLFLNLKKKRRIIKKKPIEGQNTDEPTKVGIGVAGGFQYDGSITKTDFIENNSLVIFPQSTVIQLPNEQIPQNILVSITAILAADDGPSEIDFVPWEEKRFVSKHAENLVQLDNGIKVPPTGWKCSKCDKTDNLWLNLTDGEILCGRKYFDGTGGNNHAVDHFGVTKYPLAVKLGTITPDGGDVFSYDEDEMVLDPKLDSHLAHFGINITIMQKTDKTIDELQIDLNKRFGEWLIIQESGKNLEALFGPGLTGMRNLGNTCYLNSVLQILFSIPDFQLRYYGNPHEVLSEATLNPTSDLELQLTKLADGLLSGRYSVPAPEPVIEQEATEDIPTEQIILTNEQLDEPIPKQIKIEESSNKETRTQEGISPKYFKLLIGQGHSEFSKNRQQDAQEFFLHVLNKIEQSQQKSKPGKINPCDCFRFQIEEKIQCLQSNKVSYVTRDDFLLTLPIPLEAAINKQLVEIYQKEKESRDERKKKGEVITSEETELEVVRYKIPLAACLSSFSNPTQIEQFFSTATKNKGFAQKTIRMVTFPDYLMIQIAKFDLGLDWVPYKLDVEIEGMLDQLNLESIRGHGIQPGEEELPPQEPDINMSLVLELSEMGFHIEGCKKAVYYTENSGLEPATNWIVEHMGDHDFEIPLELKTPQIASNSVTIDEEAVLTLLNFGFTRDQAIIGLKQTQNSVERAADWLFSHPEELTKLEQTTQEPATNDRKPKFRDGPGIYELFAFVSHMGTSTMSGHYVCHIKKEGQWILFNDEKVLQSQDPPVTFGYLYLYRRVST